MLSSLWEINQRLLGLHASFKYFVWRQHVSDSSVTILERSKHLLEGWMTANCKQSSFGQGHITSTSGLHKHDDQNLDNRIRDIRWRKPRNGRLKCNVDASFYYSSNKVGIDICVRDLAGNHIRSKTMWFTPLCLVDVGEALGLYHEFRWIYELQLTNFDFEVDSKLVAEYFNKGRGDITEFGSIVDSSIHLCNYHLTKSHKEFIMRQANEVAYKLTKASIFSGRAINFIELGKILTANSHVT